MTKVIFTVAACMALLAAGTAQAADPTVKCQQSKLKAQGKLQSCLRKNASSVLGGKTDQSADCQTKFTTALQKADDKATAAATSCRYIDNGDGTVSDLDTGLVWEKKDDLGGIHDKDNLYTWAIGGSTPNGTAFTGFLGALNGGTSSDGTNTVTACFTSHCDWRLPTIQELQGVVDFTAAGCGSGSPCIDSTFGATMATAYWSATTDSSGSSFVWYVDFGPGYASPTNKTVSAYARAVRGGL